jgi:phytoene dehydrogenase-like protein
MPSATRYDAVIVGSGPNGLAAAITLAQAGRSVLVLEAENEIGGGTRTAEVTLPGFRHDLCSAIHPLGAGSPFFRKLPLQEFGLEWIYPPVELAHPLDDGSAATLYRSIQSTGESLGPDAAAYQRLIAPLVRDWEKILGDFLGPLPLPPRHPLSAARFGLLAILPATGLADRWFQATPARALFAGMAAHAIRPLERPMTSAIGLVMSILGHSVGWPMPRGGSQQIAFALAGYLRTLGGEIQTGRRVTSLRELPPSRCVLLDLTPRQFLQIAGEQLPPGYRSQLQRYRYGPGVFKVDYALSAPIPWKAPQCRQAATVHIGGQIEEVARSERAVWRGEHPEKPFVLLAQQSLFDPSRAPQGKHTAWAYCHVPNGSTVDLYERITAQIERFAPGFRNCILAHAQKNTAEMEAYNPNYVGGDINGGVLDLMQLFTRPVWRRVPYSTPLKGVFLCSSSTPPAGGVHGMCGYHAARAALRAGY